MNTGDDHVWTGGTCIYIEHVLHSSGVMLVFQPGLGPDWSWDSMHFVGPTAMLAKRAAVPLRTMPWWNLLLSRHDRFEHQAGFLSAKLLTWMERELQL